jgi:hypothetical protein
VIVQTAGGVCHMHSSREQTEHRPPWVSQQSSGSSQHIRLSV